MVTVSFSGWSGEPHCRIQWGQPCNASYNVNAPQGELGGRGGVGEDLMNLKQGSLDGGRMKSASAKPGQGVIGKL